MTSKLEDVNRRLNESINHMNKSFDQVFVDINSVFVEVDNVFDEIGKHFGVEELRKGVVITEGNQTTTYTQTTTIKK